MNALTPTTALWSVAEDIPGAPEELLTTSELYTRFQEIATSAIAIRDLGESHRIQHAAALGAQAIRRNTLDRIPGYGQQLGLTITQEA